MIRAASDVMLGSKHESYFQPDAASRVPYADVWQGSMRFYVAVAVVLLSGCATRVPRDTVTATSLENGTVQVIGRLGNPLGTVSKIEAVIVEIPEKLETFGGGFGQQYGLRVEKVDGKVLDEPVIVRFVVDRAGPLVKLAESEMGLRHLIEKMTLPGQFWVLTEDGHLTDAKRVSRTEAERVREGYVGSRHKLLAFETGYFFGVPHGVPDGYGFVYAVPHSYHFGLHLTVFAELETEKHEPNRAPQ